MKPVNQLASEPVQALQYRVWTAVQVPAVLQEREQEPVPEQLRVLQVPEAVSVP